MNPKNPRFDDSDFPERDPIRDFKFEGNFLPYLGKADANIATRTSGTVSVWQGVLGSETDTTRNVTAYNISDQQADSGTWVLLTPTTHGLALLPLECPA